MATGNSTLPQLQTINDENLSGGVADELLQGAPLVRVMAALPASNGTDHKWLQYGGTDPALDQIAADFRDVNTGRQVSHSVDTMVSIECKILDASTLVDAAIADGYRFGREAWLQREAMRALRSAFQRLEKQVINGTAGSPFSDANGFLGFADYMSAVGDQVISAGGATNLTSAYVIRSADPLESAAIVLGQDGNIEIGTSREQGAESADGLYYNALWTPIHSWYAYQHASKFSGVRIANIDSASATPVLDDDLLSDAISRFPVDRPATHIVYNRKVWNQHRTSRTATNATGSEAPFPMDAYGLPIVVTDQIDNSETLVS